MHFSLNLKIDSILDKVQSKSMNAINCNKFIYLPAWGISHIELMVLHVNHVHRVIISFQIVYFKFIRLKIHCTSTSCEHLFYHTKLDWWLLIKESSLIYWCTSIFLENYQTQFTCINCLQHINHLSDLVCNSGKISAIIQKLLNSASRYCIVCALLYGTALDLLFQVAQIVSKTEPRYL